MEFRYRYVDYGTRFRWHPSARRPAAGPPDPPPNGGPPALACRTTDRDAPEQLYDNELVLDVGGVAWGHRDTDLPVLDHHFAWDLQFPSASAAVLHNVARIYEYFHHPRHLGTGQPFAPPDTVWLVSHQQPDFDAFCSMYLARRVIEGAIPRDGWDRFGVAAGQWGHVPARGRVDWFRPRVPDPADDDARNRRWAMHLAAYASLVDQCKRIGCPRERALHSVLYAAGERGRAYGPDGAVPFFQAAEPQLVLHQLNPLTDSVLDGVERFGPELRLLDRQPAAYQRDLARARTAVVFLRRATRPFGDWFPQVEDRATGATPPFREGPGHPVHPVHRDQLPDGHVRPLQTDGIFIRDPECLLFKEWARQDAAHSSLGRGFLFTAVAYSGGRAGNPTNTTDYFFSLDPERADGAHLYDVWSHLQEAEMKASAPVTGPAGPPPPREEFEARGRTEPGYFADPWFDGQSYACTIVPTPNRGTFIGPAGARADLTDDPVVGLVRAIIEYRVTFQPTAPGRGEVEVLDASPDERPPGGDPPFRHVPIGHPPGPPEAGRYRLATVLLNPAIDLTAGDTARQVGSALWSHLGAADAFAGRPDRPLPLAVSPDWVAVWTEHGLGVAAKPHSPVARPDGPGRPPFAGLADQFRRLIRLSAQLTRLVLHTDALARCEQAEAAWRRLPGWLQRLRYSDPAWDEIERRRAATAAERDRAERDRDAHRQARETAGDCEPGSEHDEEALAAAGQRLLATVADLRHTMTTPAGAPLRGFFEASGIERVLGGWVQTHQAMAVGANVHRIADVQSKLKWAEIFIIAVYAVELMDHISRVRHHGPAVEWGGWCWRPSGCRWWPC